MEREAKQQVLAVVDKVQAREGKKGFWRRIKEAINPSAAPSSMPQDVPLEGTQATPHMRSRSQDVYDYLFKEFSDVDTYADAYEGRLRAYFNVQDAIGKCGFIMQAKRAIVSEVMGQKFAESFFYISSENTTDVDRVSHVLDRLRIDSNEFVSSVVSDLIEFGVALYRKGIDYEHGQISMIERVSPYRIRGLVVARYESTQTRYTASIVGGTVSGNIELMENILATLGTDATLGDNIPIGFIIANRSMKDQVMSVTGIVGENYDMRSTPYTSSNRTSAISYTFVPIWEFAYVFNEASEEAPLGVPYFYGILSAYRTFLMKKDIVLMSSYNSIPRECFDLGGNSGETYQALVRYSRDMKRLLSNINPVSATDGSSSPSTDPVYITGGMDYKLLTPPKQSEALFDVENELDELLSAIGLPRSVALPSDENANNDSGLALSKRFLAMRHKVLGFQQQILSLVGDIVETDGVLGNAVATDYTISMRSLDIHDDKTEAEKGKEAMERIGALVGVMDKTNGADAQRSMIEWMCESGVVTETDKRYLLGLVVDDGAQNAGGGQRDNVFRGRKMNSDAHAVFAQGSAMLKNMQMVQDSGQTIYKSDVYKATQVLRKVRSGSIVLTGGNTKHEVMVKNNASGKDEKCVVLGCGGELVTIEGGADSEYDGTALGCADEDDNKTETEKGTAVLMNRLRLSG